MSISTPRQTLVCFAWTPEYVDRLIRDLLRAAIVAGNHRACIQDQEVKDACSTTISNLKLAVSRLERGLESRIGLGEG
jgi:hypothetical protein